PKKFNQLQTVFKKWDLDAEVIGEVINNKKIQLFWQGQLLTDIDPDLLVENAPKYDRSFHQWNKKNLDDSWQRQLPDVSSITEKLMSILKDVRGCSRKWIYRQYDQRVGARTARDCSDSIGVIALPQTQRALGVVLGHRPYLTQWDAAEGAKDAIIFPALELSAKGFLPLAVTDCLNFGNPEKPEIMSEFVAAVENMSAACEALDTPVISGNVSFYNETLGENIISTPATGLVGLKNELTNIPLSHFTADGSQIYLLRLPQLHMSGQTTHKEKRNIKGHGTIDVKESAQFCEQVRELSQQPGVQSTRACGKLGLAYNLARMCTNELGFQVNKGQFLGENEENSQWFTEQYYEVLFVVSKDKHVDFAKSWAQTRKTNSRDQLWRIGEVTKGQIGFESEKSIDVKLVLEAYEDGWRESFESLA
ncbi:MAG: hypothetical protein KDD58_14470, partial [Bdellovibrionales bacterium]|nr:hypothetical protein [Bdellovibrionales bacterium]